MVIQSKLKHETEAETEDQMHQVWTSLYESGHLVAPPTECGNRCSDYALRNHRDSFFAVNPIGPWTCTACGAERKKNEIQVDHVDFIHNGLGSHNCPENLQPMCGKCNQGRKRPNSPRAHELWGRDNRSKAAMGRPKSPEHRAAIAASVRRQWEALPEAEKDVLREKMRAGQLSRWSKMTPEERLAATEVAREAASRPEVRAKANRTTWSRYTDEERAERVEAQREGFEQAWYGPGSDKRSRAGRHGRLHVDRGITDPDCEFCLSRVARESEMGKLR